jgi:uncharacterized membrane protein
MAALVGCNKSEPGGVTKPSHTTTTGGSGKASTSQSFKISAPTGASNIKQGATETFKVTLDRGSDFKDDVMLTVTAPADAKLKVEPMTKTVKASEDKTVSVTVTADKDAPLGKHRIHVEGKPTTGESTSVDFDVEVVKP